MFMSMPLVYVQACYRFVEDRKLVYYFFLSVNNFSQVKIGLHVQLQPRQNAMNCIISYFEGTSLLYLDSKIGHVNSASTLFKGAFALASFTAFSLAKMTGRVAKAVLSLVPWVTRQHVGLILFVVTTPKEPRQVPV